MAETIIAVDLGASKTAVALVNGVGEIGARRVEPTCREGPSAWLTQFRRMTAALLPAGKPDGIGLSVAGTAHDASGVVEWVPNLADWEDVPLGDLLRPLYDCPVAMGNDGHMAALGEGWLGAGREVRDFVCVVIGTGVGSGLILDGRLYAGAHAIAGAIGWSVRDNDGPNLEEAIAGPALEKRVLAEARAGKRTRLSALLHEGDQEPPVKCLFEAAQEGDRVAVRIVMEAIDRLGRVLANVVSLLNPQTILLGGSVGLAMTPWIPDLQRWIAIYAQPHAARQVTVEAAQLGQDAPLLGATRAALAKLDR